MLKVICLAGLILFQFSTSFSSMSICTIHDQMKLQKAQNLLDQHKFSESINVLDKLTSKCKKTEQARRSRGAALAGECSFDFISWMNALETAIGPNIFMVGIALLKNGALNNEPQSLNPWYCAMAEQEYRAIIDQGTQNTSDYRIVLALLGVAKAHMILHNAADLSPMDGIIDSTFSACNQTSLSDYDVNQVITGISSFIENFSAIPLSPDSPAYQMVAQTAFDCNVYVAMDPMLPPQLQGRMFKACNITEVNNIDQDIRYVLRSLLADRNFGVGKCDSFDNPLGLFDCCRELRLELYGM